eukprot:685747-Prymnesium_polylepis.1
MGSSESPLSKAARNSHSKAGTTGDPTGRQVASTMATPPDRRDMLPTPRQGVHGPTVSTSRCTSRSPRRNIRETFAKGCITE